MREVAAPTRIDATWELGPPPHGRLYGVCPPRRPGFRRRPPLRIFKNATDAMSRWRADPGTKSDVARCAGAPARHRTRRAARGYRLFYWARNSASALLDTGVSIILTPTPNYYWGGYWASRCSNFLSITFFPGGERYQLTPKLRYYRCFMYSLHP
jgi:hypothetical protein